MLVIPPPTVRMPPSTPMGRWAPARSCWSDASLEKIPPIFASGLFAVEHSAPPRNDIVLVVVAVAVLAVTVAVAVAVKRRK